MQLLLIALGGALGAVARYGVSRVSQPDGAAGFPLGTLVVNLSGAFLLGLLATLLLERTTISPELRAAATIGVLGAYTTFSTFSLETLALLDDGEWWYAGVNVIASVSGSIILAWIGQQIARSWA